MIKMTDEMYFADPAISNSDLSVFVNKGKVEFYNYKYNKQEDKESKSHFDLGTLIHAMLLEPKEIDNKFVVYDGEHPNSANKKAFVEYILNNVSVDVLQEAYESSYNCTKIKPEEIKKKANELYKELQAFIDYKRESKGKIGIKHEEFGKAIECKDTLLNNLAYTRVLGDYQWTFEEPIFKEYMGMTIKGKLDGRATIAEKGVILDIKTTRSANPKDFLNSIYKFGYYRQLSFYDILFPSEEFYIAAIQTEPPYYSVIYKLDSNIIKGKYRDIINKDLEELKKVIDSQDFTYSDFVSIDVKDDTLNQIYLAPYTESE